MQSRNALVAVLIGAVVVACSGWREPSLSTPPEVADSSSPSAGANAELDFWPFTPGGPNRVVYVDRNEVVVAHPDGSHPRTIATDAARASVAVWSPDSRLIAYWSGRWRGDGMLAPADLVVVEASGANPRVVSGRFKGSPLQPPSWAPDSSALVFDGARQPYAVNADGSGLRRLVAHAALRDLRTAAWSPDGAWIAFAGSLPRGGDQIRQHVFVVRSDGTGLTQVSSSGNADGWADPQWSPDGSVLLYATGGADAPGHALALQGNAGWLERPLLPSERRPRAVWSAGPQHARWAPDGAHVAYVATGTEEDVNGRSLHVAAVDGSWDQQLDVYSYPCWTPDAHSLLVIGEARSEGPQLLHLETGTRVPLSDLPAVDSVTRACSWGVAQ